MNNHFVDSRCQSFIARQGSMVHFVDLWLREADLATREAFSIIAGSIIGFTGPRSTCHSAFINIKAWGPQVILAARRSNASHYNKICITIIETHNRTKWYES